MTGDKLTDADKAEGVSLYYNRDFYCVEIRDNEAYTSVAFLLKYPFPHKFPIYFTGGYWRAVGISICRITGCQDCQPI